MTIEFTVKAPNVDMLPSSQELSEGLVDGLPKEWFDRSGADWWVSRIDRT